MATHVDCLIETGAKRTFVAVAGWPGWCRAGRDEAAGLDLLWAYRDRYAAAMEAGGVRFPVPRSPSALRVTERAAGNATTDFGAPDATFDADAESIAGREWSRLRSVVEACWGAFDRAAIEAEGVELTHGPARRRPGAELDRRTRRHLGSELPAPADRRRRRARRA